MWSYPRYHNLQGLSGRHLVELRGEVQMLRFEKERNGFIHQELLKEHQHIQLEQEKQQKKVNWTFFFFFLLFYTFSGCGVCDNGDEGGVADS